MSLVPGSDSPAVTTYLPLSALHCSGVTSMFDICSWPLIEPLIVPVAVPVAVPGATDGATVGDADAVAVPVREARPTTTDVGSLMSRMVETVASTD